jgi:hypothetical protein
MERRIKDDKLLETVERIQKRIADRFPGSGLSQVAAELVQVTRESVDRAKEIRRPNYWIRAGLIVVGWLLIIGLARHFYYAASFRAGLGELVDFVNSSMGISVYLVAAAIFLVTLEIRFKRRKALRAVHELRAMAHLIDMHQLNKDPERVGSPDAAKMESGRPMTYEELGQYLNYCTDLLAIVSKIGQLYVQDLPDPTAAAAVDQFEQLATGLSSKIWQKMMILDRITTDEP